VRRDRVQGREPLSGQVEDMLHAAEDRRDHREAKVDVGRARLAPSRKQGAEVGLPKLLSWRLRLEGAVPDPLVSQGDEPWLTP
jgi:hypothetical protein